MNVNWTVKFFSDLNPDELYQVLRLRSEVFVMEQSCLFLDMDNKDQECWHLMGWIDGRLAAYTRLVPPGLAYTQASIGRVVSAPDYRRTGVGRTLMEKSIRECEKLFGPVPIKIGAQLYLESFYRSFGFETSSGVYLEDGIKHVEMIRPAQ